MFVSWPSVLRPAQEGARSPAGHCPASTSALATRQTHQRLGTCTMQAAIAPPLPTSVVGGNWRRRRPSRHARSVAASARPCVLLTGPDGPENLEGLHLLAAQVRSRLGCEALILVPGSSCGATWAGQLSLDRQLDLRPLAAEDGSAGGGGPPAFALDGATGADCVMAGADHTAGLARQLGLTVAMVAVGISRGPALSSDVDFSPAVAVARQAALLGLPTVAACLATPSPGAPLQPAVEAAGEVLARAAGVLDRHRGWPLPVNHPRAHFPFPTRGRWALGTSLPLPGGSRAAAVASHEYAVADCWALGEDNSWLGGGAPGAAGGGGGTGAVAPVEARQLLQRAFAEGDLLLLLNVPPTWRLSRGGGGGGACLPFSSARPGVLWHCWQAESAGMQQVAGDTAAAEPAGWGVGPAAGEPRRSWDASSGDLYGRSLPNQGYGSRQPTAGAFVSQDNTAAVGAAAAWRSQGAGGAAATHDQPQPQQREGQWRVPSSFTIRAGRLLADSAAAGDVEAVMGGRASLAALQAWPPGHPFHLLPEVMLHALEEGEDGLPLWLC